MKSMSSRRRNAWISRALIVGVCGLFCLGLLPQAIDTVYETDQAAILAGCLALRGAAPLDRHEFYNYDRQFLTYRLHAWIQEGLHRLDRSLSPVTASNLVCLIGFWSALALAGCVGRIPRGRFPWFVSVATAPCLLLHSSFLTSAFFSASFLLLLWSILQGWRGRALLLPAYVLSFAAVGARGDAALILPWMLWLSRARREPSPLVRLGTWCAAGLGAVTALAIGATISPMSSLWTNRPVFHPRVFAAYTVFGLGGCLVLACTSVYGTVAAACGARTRKTRLARCLGLLCLLFPLGFYAVQLYSIRYLCLPVLAFTLWMLSPRGWAMLRVTIKRPLRNAVGWLAAGIGILLLFVGIQLPTPAHPRVTLDRPTVFPTMDGNAPMGAMIAFLGNRWNCSEGFCGHGDPLWHAARDAEFEEDISGAVPLVRTPMYWYLAYAVLRDGKTVHPVGVREALSLPLVYADSRSLWRRWVGRPGIGDRNQTQGGMLARDVAYVSPVFDGIGILRIGPGESDLARLLLTAREVFRGNDFRMRRDVGSRTGCELIAKMQRTGRQVAIVSRNPLRVNVEWKDGSREWKESAALRPPWHAVTMGGPDPVIRELSISGAYARDSLVFLYGALPAYMSVGAFRAPDASGPQRLTLP